MAVIEIDDELRARFQEVAAPEDLNVFIANAMRERITWHERREAIRRNLQDEIQAIKEGRYRTAEESNAEFRRRHNIPDLSHLTPDQLADKAEAAIAAMDPAVRAKLECEGLL